MRSFTYVVTGLFLIYSIQPPLVRAAEPAAPTTRQEATEQVFSFMEEAGIELLDERDLPLSPEKFVKAPPKTFSILSEENGGTLKFKASLGDVRNGISASVVVSEPESGKVISRRKVSLSQETDASAGKLRFQQTMQSLHNDIQKFQKTKVGHRTALSTIKLALIQLIGIPSAHADENRNNLIGIGAIVVMTLVAIGVGCILDMVKETTEIQIKKSLIRGAVAISVTALGALTTTILVGLCSDQLIRIIKAFRGQE